MGGHGDIPCHVFPPWDNLLVEAWDHGQCSSTPRVSTVVLSKGALHSNTQLTGGRLGGSEVVPRCAGACNDHPDAVGLLARCGGRADAPNAAGPRGAALVSSQYNTLHPIFIFCEPNFAERSRKRADGHVHSQERAATLLPFPSLWYALLHRLNRPFACGGSAPLPSFLRPQELQHQRVATSVLCVSTTPGF